MKPNEYSPYKCLHHLDSLRAGRPLLCYWLITMRCNYGCPVCINKHMGQMRRSDELGLDEAVEYAEQIKNAGVKALSISGGEPLLHRNFNELMVILLRMDFEIGMISNGSLLGRVDIELIKQFKWFRISVNSMSAISFESVHGVKSKPIWQTLEHNVPELRSKGCVVGSSFLVQPENIREIRRFCGWSKSVGFSSCRYSYVRRSNGRVEYSTEDKEEIIRATSHAKEDFEDEGFRVFSLSDRMDISEKKAFDHCSISDLSFSICANGNVYRCCSLQNTKLGFLGSLKERSFEDIWRNRGDQNLSQCPMCWQAKKNEILEYMIHENPLHVNFI